MGKKWKALYAIFSGCLLIGLLVTIWFHGGNILATGEGGLFFYNFNYILHLFGQTWFTGTIGFPGTGLPLINIPLFISLNALFKFGYSYVVLQSITFFSLQLIGFISVFFISCLLIEEKIKKPTVVISFLAAIFYILNQINMVIILNRMQYPFLFSYALIPFGLLLLILAMRKKQLVYAFIIPIITFFLATSFSEISSIILFWIILMSFALFHLLFYEKTKKFLFFTIKFFSIAIVTWLVVNAWWILPMFKILGGSPYVTKLTYNPNGDLDAFLGLSQVLGNLTYIFRLMHHDFYVWMQTTWNGYYQNPIIILLTFLPPMLVFGSLLVKKKVTYYYYFLFMSLLTAFFMKGAVDPFGFLFQFLFTHLRVLEAFRNPFEKISIVLPLFYSIPFAVGVYGVYEFIQKQWSKIAAKGTLIAVSVICFVILVIPFWNGWVFTGSTTPANNTNIGFQVKVPAYYAQANNWLNKVLEDFRVIALPIGEEGITYNWEYGYSGVEVSNGIFDKSFISYCTTIQFLCDITHSIQPILLNYPNDFWKILPPLNVKYTMLRKDTDYRVDQMQNPNDLKNKINSAENIKKEKSFGPLTFYSGNTSYSTPKIFVATQGIYLNGENSFVDAVPLVNFEKNDIYFTGDSSLANSLNHSHQIILQANEFTPPQLQINKENALLELPYVRFLPSSPFYLWIRLKENIDNFLAGNSNLPNRVIQSDKRLVESYKLLQIGKAKIADKTLGEYLSLLSQFYQSNVQFAQDKEKEDLLRQKYVLQDAIVLAKQNHDTNTVYGKSLQTLNVLLKNSGLIPLLTADLSTNRVYDVNVPTNGKYSIEISKQDYEKYYPTTVLSGKIDENTYLSSPINTSDSFITFGTFYFSKGEHQINIVIPQATNLLSVNSLTMSIKHTEAGIESNTYTLPINNFNSNARYILSFDYKVTSGKLFKVFFNEDSDITINDKVIPHYDLSLSLQYGGHEEEWYHYEIPIVPNAVSHSGKLVFHIYHGNTCKGEDDTAPNCKNIPSSAEIKNLSFTRTDLGSVFLTKDQSVMNRYTAPKISFKENNPARYYITVNGAKTPFYLTFLEAYHPLWKLYYLDNGKEIPVSEQRHLFVNSYANAWLLDKKGNYTMLLEFAPEGLFEIGKIISIGTFSILTCGVIIYLAIRVYKKIKQ